MDQLLPVSVIIAIVLLVIITELVKKLDKKNRLKGCRVWVPAIFSGGAAQLLRIGQFFNPPEQVWFWWAVIFAFAVFAYEAILKKITTALGADGTPSK